LLDGLEISVINYLDTFLEDTPRLDSDYYLKKFLEVKQKSKKLTGNKISELNINTDASAFYPALEPYYNTGDFPFLRVGDIKVKVDYENCIKIPESILVNYPTLKKVTAGDIVLTKGGTIGIIGLIEADACVSRDLIFLNTSILPEIDYVSLFIILNTNFCFLQLVRSSSQSVQPHLTVTLVKDIFIPKLSEELKLKIFKLYTDFKNLLQTSQTLYSRAERILLEELDLWEWQPPTENIAIKTFQESFGTSGRLDAEYYQPKYEAILAKMKVIKTEKLGNIVKIKKSIEPGSDAYQSEGIPFIRVSNLSKFELSSTEIYLSETDFGNKVELFPKKDTILFSKDGTVGIAYKTDKDYKVITSGAILHLNIKIPDLFPDYLTLVLNSSIVALQAERDAGGSIIQHWRVSEIEQITIPLLPLNIQSQISDLINESFNLRRESKRLLEVAKRGVEMAIEAGEVEALAWIEENTKVKS